MDKIGNSGGESATGQDASGTQREDLGARPPLIDPKIKPVVETPKSEKSESESQKETLDAIKKGERIALIIAATVAFATIGQWVTTSCNNASTSAQTDKLIKAAQMSAHSSAHNAAAATSFSQSADKINEGIKIAVEKLNSQADATKKLAAQALQQTRIAKEALHVTERAYVTAGSPHYDTGLARITIPLINSGRIPSGKVDITAFEFTLTVPFPSIPQSAYPLEKHWTSSTIQSIPTGSPFLYFISASQAKASSLENGEQRILIGGTISYRDGFPDTKNHVWQFCDLTFREFSSGTMFFSPCDYSEKIAPLMEFIKYPTLENYIDENK